MYDSNSELTGATQSRPAFLNSSPEDLLRRLGDAIETSCPIPDIDIADHPSSSDLVAFVTGAPTGKSLNDIERHIESCEDCAVTMDRIVEIAVAWKSRLESIPPIHEPDAPVVVPEPAHETEGGSSPDRPKELPFAINNESIDREAKQLLASFIVPNLQLKTGYGLFLDAGSQCLYVWERLKELLQTGGVRFIHLLTWNLRVLVKLYDWQTQNPNKRHCVDLKHFGNGFDLDHQSTYDMAARPPLMSGDYCPNAVIIGVTGVEFGDRRISIGYHGMGDVESKSLLFQISCKRRIILATTPKIGNAGALRFNLLAVDGIKDIDVPIELFTPAPDPESDEEYRVFAKSAAAYWSLEMQHAIRHAGITFSWKVVRKNKDGNLEAYDVPKFSLEDFEKGLQAEEPVNHGGETNELYNDNQRGGAG